MSIEALKSMHYEESYRPRIEYRVNSSRYPVTLRCLNKAKVAGFRVKPGMTTKDLRGFFNRKCCPINLFWTDVVCE
jgi:hypothetical protein